MSHCPRPHVLVTGASSGVGHAIALYLGTAGHHVYAGVRKPDDGAALQRDARGEVTPLILDVTDGEQIRADVDTVPTQEAADLAEACIAGLEGALMIARVAQSADPIDRVERALTGLLG